jgi:hypothetical protein
VVEVAAAAEQNDQLIESRTASRTKANAQAASWSASEQQYHARKRAEIRAQWYAFFCQMAENHRRLSEDYERRGRRRGVGCWTAVPHN